MFTVMDQGIFDHRDSDADTGGITAPFDVQAGPIELDAGMYSLAEIQGQKFEDLDGNGHKDEGEPPLAGWTIFLDSDTDGVLDDGEPQVVTDGCANFCGHGLNWSPWGTLRFSPRHPTPNLTREYCHNRRIRPARPWVHQASIVPSPNGAK